MQRAKAVLEEEAPLEQNSLRDGCGDDLREPPAEEIGYRKQLRPIWKLDLRAAFVHMIPHASWYRLQKTDKSNDVITFKEMQSLNEKVHMMGSNQAQKQERPSQNGEQFLVASAISGAQVSAATFHARMLEDGCSRATLPWVHNHCRWARRKLLLYEMLFPAIFSSRVYTAEAIYAELHHRYRREYVSKAFSCLYKLFMNEASCASRMVLCIAKVCDDSTVELTDGWYGVRAKLDHDLSDKVLCGKMHVGQKLSICLSQWHSPHGPCHPLDGHEEVTLSLHANGVFPESKFAKLGFGSKSSDFLSLIRLSDIKADGGLVPSTFFLVEKVYPLIYMDKNAQDGTKKQRSAEKHQNSVEDSENRKQSIAEALMQAMQDKCSEDDLQDPVRVAALNAEYSRKLIAAFDRAGLGERSVTTILKLRVSSIEKAGYSYMGRRHIGALLTIWRPDEDLVHRMKPGMIFKGTHLMPSEGSEVFSASLALESTKNSTWLPCGNMYDLKSTVACNSLASSAVRKLQELQYAQKGHEFDFTGIPVLATHTETGKQLFMTETSPEDAQMFWTIAIHVGEDCTGERFAEAKTAAALSFQNLSFTFADPKNMIVNAKASIASICSRTVRRMPAANFATLACLRKRLEALIHAQQSQ